MTFPSSAAETRGGFHVGSCGPDGSEPYFYYFVFSFLPWVFVFWVFTLCRNKQVQAEIMRSCALLCLPGMSLLCPGTSPDVHGGLGIQRSSWRESKGKKKNRKDCLALPKYFPIGIQQPRHSMKRKKGEGRGEGGGLGCHGLRVSLCASSLPRRGLRWVGADVPIFPAWPRCGLRGSCPRRRARQLASTWCWAPRAPRTPPCPLCPQKTAGFPAKPQGSVFHVATARPSPARHRAHCQTPLTPCSPHSCFFFS